MGVIERRLWTAALGAPNVGIPPPRRSERPRGMAYIGGPAMVYILGNYVMGVFAAVTVNDKIINVGSGTTKRKEPKTVHEEHKPR